MGASAQTGHRRHADAAYRGDCRGRYRSTADHDDARRDPAGDLVQLLPGWQPQGGVIHIVYPSRRGMLPAVRLLIDFLAQQFAALEEA